LELNSILLKYYDPSQIHALLLLLKSYGVHEDLQAAASRFYLQFQNKEKPSPEISFTELVDEYLRISFHPSEQVYCKEFCEKDVDKLLDALVFLMIDAMEFSNIPPQSFYATLKKTIDIHTSDINEHCWKYYRLLSLAMKKISDDSASKHSESGATSGDANFTLHWIPMAEDSKNKINAEAFASDIVILLNGTESVSAILSLFNPKLAPLPIRIPCKHIPALLILFSLLHKCGRITCSPSRGMYKFLRSRMKAVGNEKLPMRSDYSKIRCEALSHPKTKQFLQESLNDIFRKYCCDRKFKFIFSRYFSCKPQTTQKRRKSPGR